jgi:pyruvate kinase
VETRRKVALYRGVYAIPFDLLAHERKHLNAAAVAELESREIVSKGDLVILTKGDQVGLHGGTNAMKILRVGEVH